MLKYKWCVCDMDGTLLNSKNVISEENEAALKILQHCGLEVIIASGRIDLLMKPFIKQLELQGHIICCNGGLIKNLKTGEIIYSKTIENAAVRKITAYCLSNSINFLMYTTELVYSTNNNPRAEKYESLNMFLSKELQVPIKYIDDAVLENLDDLEVLKILLVCGDQETVKSLEKHFSGDSNLTVVSSESDVLDIMAADISKGNGLKILAEKLKVDLNNVIAIGDNYNDLNMLKCVGMPIAVENAVDEVKSEAKFITRSNEESGVAYAINNYILHDFV